MNTALLIIDIQNDYFQGGHMPLANADSAAANSKLLLDRFRAEHLPVVHVQHVATQPNAPFFVAFTPAWPSMKHWPRRQMRSW